MDQLAKDSKDVYFQKNVMKSRCKFRLTGIVYELIEIFISIYISSQLYSYDLNFKSGQLNSGNSFSTGPSFNPRPTYPSGNSFNRPSNQGSNWNQGNWQRPTYPDYQSPFNNRPNGQQSFNTRPIYQPPYNVLRPTFGNGVIA